MRWPFFRNETMGRLRRQYRTCQPLFSETRLPAPFYRVNSSSSFHVPQKDRPRRKKSQEHFLKKMFCVTMDFLEREICVWPPVEMLCDHGEWCDGRRRQGTKKASLAGRFGLLSWRSWRHAHPAAQKLPQISFTTKTISASAFQSSHIEENDDNCKIALSGIKERIMNKHVRARRLRKTTLSTREEVDGEEGRVHVVGATNTRQVYSFLNSSHCKD